MAGMTNVIDTATPAIQRVMRMASPEQQRGFLMAWAIKGRDLARAGARKRPGRTWRDIARSVTVVSVAGGVVFRTDHVAAAQKQFGGKIVAKDAEALTIPIAPEAKGHRASEFETGGRNLFVLPSKSPETIGLLGYNETVGKGSRDSSGRYRKKAEYGASVFHPLFLLRKSVTQKAQPWWPEDSEILAAGVDLAQKFANRNTRG